MSLINEALKKAQNQRAAGAAAQPTPPSVQSPESPPPLVRIPKRRPPLAARTLMGLVGTVLAGLIVIAAVGYFGYPSVSDQPAPVAPKPVVQVPAPAPPPSTCCASDLGFPPTNPWINAHRRWDNHGGSHSAPEAARSPRRQPENRRIHCNPARSRNPTFGHRPQSHPQRPGLPRQRSS